MPFSGLLLAASTILGIGFGTVRAQASRLDLTVEAAFGLGIATGVLGAFLVAAVVLLVVHLMRPPHPEKHADWKRRRGTPSWTFPSRSGPWWASGAAGLGPRVPAGTREEPPDLQPAGPPRHQ